MIWLLIRTYNKRMRFKTYYFWGNKLTNFFWMQAAYTQIIKFPRIQLIWQQYWLSCEASSQLMESNSTTSNHCLEQTIPIRIELQVIYITCPNKIEIWSSKTKPKFIFKFSSTMNIWTSSSANFSERLFKDHKCHD